MCILVLVYIPLQNVSCMAVIVYVYISNFRKKYDNIKQES